MGLEFGEAQGMWVNLAEGWIAHTGAHRSLLQTSRTKSAYQVRLQYAMSTESERKCSHWKNPSNWVTGEGILSPTLRSLTWYGKTDKFYGVHRAGG